MKSQVRFTQTYRLMTVAMVVALTWVTANVTAAEPATNVTTQTFGSGKLFKTTVERQTEGGLSPDDLHQASLLTSQLLNHLNTASQQLADGRGEAARPAIEQAESLVKVVRGLLPTTVVTTVTRDTQGKEVYRNVQRVQDDQIPIFQGQVSLEAVEPIVEAKRDEAALKGLKLAEAELIHTSVLVDLSYVERKLKRAGELLANPKEAGSELALAQTQGVHFYARREDSPLVEVQHALRLAERQVQENKFEGAIANLQLAKLGLDTYRTLIGVEAGKPVIDLQNDIQKLSGELQKPETAGKIRGLWEKVASWFKRESGQAVTTTPKEEPKS